VRARGALRARSPIRRLPSARPPRRARTAARGPCWSARPATRDTLLSSPIILEDHPRIAPESPGDLFDGGEIDQLLILNILSLTDEEKAEVRASDPRVREILDRSEALSPAELMRLHGRTVREVQMRDASPLGGLRAR
jgi:hypothetical protein